jgi:hypothetical protein
MTPQALVATLTKRGVRLMPDGDELVVQPASKLSACEREAIRSFKQQLLQLLSTPTFDPDAGEIAAARLANTVIGDCWLVKDEKALLDNPDIIRSGLPVFFFDEVERLRGKTPGELKAIGMVKATFPTSRVLQ